MRGPWVFGRFGRIWSVSNISVVGPSLNPALNLLAVPFADERLGRGGAGLGAASTTVATETFACLPMLTARGGAGVDRRLITTLAKTEPQP